MATDDESSGPTIAAPAARERLRGLPLVALVAIVVHLAARAHFAIGGRFFASEDDAYRTYLAYLMARGGEIVGRFWLPGHGFAMTALQLLGVPVAWSGVAAGTLSVVALGAALRDVTRSIAPPDLRAPAGWAAVLLLAASPMTLVLGHSSLAEPLECALVMTAAAAFVRRARGASRYATLAGAIALLAATWVRYEAWAVAAALPAVLYVLRRRAGAPPRAAVADAAIGAVPLVGPVAWMAAQAVRWGDPFTFVDQVSAMSAALVGRPSAWLVFTHRFGALAVWAPATVALAVAGAVVLRDHRPARRAALAFAAVAALGIAADIASGREHAVFTARLSYGLEVALWPLAALALAALAARRSAVAVPAAVAVTLALSLGVARPAEIQDRGSVTAGLMLRRGDLEARIGAGKLLVERPVQRPPFGWAALGVLWSRWDRTLWATRRAPGWEVVDPTDVAHGRWQVKPPELRAWLAAHAVTAAWVVRDEARDEIRAAWPEAKAIPIEAGTMFVPADPSPPR